MTNPNCAICGNPLVSMSINSPSKVVINSQTALPEWKLGDSKKIWGCERCRRYWKKGSDSISIHTSKKLRR